MPLVCTGRSKVTSNWLVESSLIRLALPVEPAPEVPTAWVVRTCGPLMISGKVFWLNGGLKMLWAVVNVTGAVSWGVGHRVDVTRRQAGVTVRELGCVERVFIGRAVGVLIHRITRLEHQLRLIARRS